LWLAFLKSPATVTEKWACVLLTRRFHYGHTLSLAERLQEGRKQAVVFRSQSGRSGRPDSASETQPLRDTTGTLVERNITRASTRPVFNWRKAPGTPPTTRGRTRLLGISKRANMYLRTRLIHGARHRVLYEARSAWNRSWPGLGP
jgi:hypothetical protein